MVYSSILTLNTRVGNTRVFCNSTRVFKKLTCLYTNLRAVHARYLHDHHK